MKNLFKKYALTVLISMGSGAAGTTAVLYYDNITTAFTCIGDIEWQLKN